VQDAAAGEVLGAGGCAVQPGGQGVADERGALEGADRAGSLGQPGEGFGLVVVELAGVLALRCRWSCMPAAVRPRCCTFLPYPRKV
jgi:hypothetical protein